MGVSLLIQVNIITEGNNYRGLLHNRPSIIRMHFDLDHDHACQHIDDIHD